MEDAKTKVTEVVDETLEYAVEKTERASERISMRRSWQSMNTQRLFLQI